jgi:CRISPR-associated protein Csm5
MSHLTTFKLKLKLLSPLFIGQGYELNKKEYLYFPKEKRVVMLNMVKFVDFLDSRGIIDDYADFMLSNQSDLRYWLENTVRGSIPYRDLSSYEMYAGDSLDDKHSLIGIQLFIKDKQGQPYIPGSSLKVR